MKRFLIILFVPLFTLGIFGERYVPLKSSTSFQIRNAGITVNGYISGMKASIFFDENNLENSKISASAAVNTIKTGIKKRDSHLQTDEYFDAKNHPEISMVLKSAKKSSNGYNGTFDLTIRGITKTVEILFTVKEEAGHHVFSGVLTLNRRDYNVGGRSMILSDDVQVNIILTTRKKS
jgi:polyisoprenoid-binding protein YceI